MDISTDSPRQFSIYRPIISDNHLIIQRDSESQSEVSLPETVAQLVVKSIPINNL